MKIIRLLPLALAATLSLPACGRADDAAAPAAASNEQTIPAGELGGANVYDGQEHDGEANILTPVDGAGVDGNTGTGPGDTPGNATTPVNAF